MFFGQQMSLRAPDTNIVYYKRSGPAPQVNRIELRMYKIEYSCTLITYSRHLQFMNVKLRYDSDLEDYLTK